MTEPRRFHSDRGAARFSPHGRRRMRGESGYVLAVTGLLIIPLIVFTAFSADLGSWYAQGSRMQRAADAAALAGVVWTNDPVQPTKWDTVARDTATRNGYTNNVNGVTVDVQKITKNQITVTIKKDGQQFFSKMFMPGGQRLSRSATAQYNLPIPLGSPRNFIGTAYMGKLSATSSSPYAREGVAASINGYCTDKVQGDQKASKYFPVSNPGSTTGCSGTANAEYVVNNYEYYVELPATRSQPVDLIVFDGQYNTGLSYGSFPADFNPGGQGQPDMSTTFTLFRADGTPLDDTDNPTMASVNGCASATAGINGTKTFNPGATGSANSNYNFNPDPTNFNYLSTTPSASGWWRLCQIPTSAPAGKYILRVQNQAFPGSTPSQTKGSNNYSLVATYTTQALCDSRVTSSCPKVYGKDYLSLRAQGSSSTADFYLAEIDRSNASKKLQVTLWDPGEGASAISLLIPTGTNSWTPVSFSWQSTVPSSGSGSSLDVTGSRFDGKLVTLTYDLTGYNPPTDNQWWKIRYQTGSGSVTDRTTWAVNVVGDPVHLVK